MAIAAYFHPKGMTLEQFNEVQRRLDAAEPEGCIHHSCFGEDGELMVFDIWDSPETFQAFGAVLMPILGEVGVDPDEPAVDPGEPAVMPIHRLTQFDASER